MRAFKSTLEDLEEKRSIHSFHSLHSIRSSRSHQGPRPLAEELLNPDPHLPSYKEALSSEQNGSYTNMGMVIQEPNFRWSGSKSRSVENMALMASVTPTVSLHGASKSPSPRTLSSSDLNIKLLASSSTHETSI